MGSDFKDFINTTIDKGDIDEARRRWQPQYKNEKLDGEWTVLHRACMYTSGDQGGLVRLLLSLDCDIEAQTDIGWRPLHVCAYHGRLEAMRALLETRCSLSPLDKAGETPLILAKEMGHHECIFLLRSAIEAARVGDMKTLKKKLTYQDDKLNKLNDQCQEIIKKISQLESESIRDSCLNTMKGNLEEVKTECKGLNERISNIRLSLTNKIRIIVIGGVSTGKSRIVNALLGRNIMQSSVSHTTRCFFRISDSKGNYIQFPKMPQKGYQTDEELKKALTDYTDNLRDRNLTENEEVKVFLEINSDILEENVYLIDTPGLDRDNYVSDLVMNKCKEMDIMIFVMNYNISNEIRRTVEKLSSVISKIPTLILINKWDDTDEDCKKDVERIKMDLEDYVNNNIVCSYRQVSSLSGSPQRRHYFISGKEKERFGSSEPYGEAEKQRYQEFKLFERDLKVTVEAAGTFKVGRHSENISNLEESSEKLNRKIISCINTFKSILTPLDKQFSKLNSDFTELLKSVTERKDGVNTGIERLKRMDPETEGEKVIKGLIDINQPFSDTLDKAVKVIKTMITMLPGKKKLYEVYVEKLKAQKRRITELNDQKKMSNKVSVAAYVGGGVTTAGGVATGAGIATGFLSAPFTVLILPAGLAIALFCAGYYCSNKSKGTDKKLKDAINKYREDLTECGKELEEAYDELEKNIKDTEINEKCSTLLEVIKEIQRFLEKRIDSG